MIKLHGEVYRVRYTITAALGTSATLLLASTLPLFLHWHRRRSTKTSLGFPIP